MYRFLNWLCASAILALIGMPTAALAQVTHTVTVSDNNFSPSQLTIEVGDTVRWVNAAGGNQHNVTSTNGAFASSTTASSFTFEVTFNQAGTFNYFCTLHANMDGTITVQGTTTPAAEVALLDLAVVGASSYSPGDDISVNAQVRNNGNAATGGFSITYYASVNNVINASDFALGTFPVADLGAGVTRNQQNQATLPDDLPVGDYFIGGILAFNDSNNNNHTAFDGGSINVTAGGGGGFQINAGLNDVWGSPGKDRQGILIAVLPEVGVFFSAWFTFDVQRPAQGATAILGEPGQRWITMEGGFEGDTADLTMYSTSGGVFDSNNPLPGQPVPIGTMTMVFHDCASATAEYSIPGIGVSNTIPLVRIVGDNIPLCEQINLALQP
jgi:plastocyanin